MWFRGRIAYDLVSESSEDSGGREGRMLPEVIWRTRNCGEKNELKYCSPVYRIWCLEFVSISAAEVNVVSRT